MHSDGVFIVACKSEVYKHFTQGVVNCTMLCHLFSDDIGTKCHVSNGWENQNGDEIDNGAMRIKRSRMESGVNKKENRLLLNVRDDIFGVVTNSISFILKSMHFQMCVRQNVYGCNKSFEAIANIVLICDYHHSASISGTTAAINSTTASWFACTPCGHRYDFW